MITCCRDCSKRTPYCHVTCEEYTKQKAEHDAQHQAEWQARNDAEEAQRVLWDSYERRNKSSMKRSWKLRK